MFQMGYQNISHFFPPKQNKTTLFLKTTHLLSLGGGEFYQKAVWTLQVHDATLLMG